MAHTGIVFSTGALRCTRTNGLLTGQKHGTAHLCFCDPCFSRVCLHFLLVKLLNGVNVQIGIFLIVHSVPILCKPACVNAGTVCLYICLIACTFQSSWFKSWPFLHYDEAQDVIFCHTGVKAFSLKRMITSHNAATAFVYVGLTNQWPFTSCHLQSFQWIAKAC